MHERTRECTHECTDFQLVTVCRSVSRDYKLGSCAEYGSVVAEVDGQDYEVHEDLVQRAEP